MHTIKKKRDFKRFIYNKEKGREKGREKKRREKIGREKKRTPGKKGRGKIICV